MAVGSAVKKLARFDRLWRLALLAVALGASFACAQSTRGAVPAGTSEPDKFLFDKGNEALEAKRWVASREYFKQVVETYTQSPYRPDAKLGVGDTYLNEGGSENLVLAINEFREFLSFYPTNHRADYAQYKLALAHARQMRAPQRDQSETRDAIREYRTFIARYPNSSACSTTGSGGIRARSIAFRRSSRATPSSPTAIRCTSISQSRTSRPSVNPKRSPITKSS
jgi:tetratricopeptide (TPR) repeat protein